MNKQQQNLIAGSQLLINGRDVSVGVIIAAVDKMIDAGFAKNERDFAIDTLVRRYSQFFPA